MSRPVRTGPALVRRPGVRSRLRLGALADQGFTYLVVSSLGDRTLFRDQRALVRVGRPLDDLGRVRLPCTPRSILSSEACSRCDVDDLRFGARGDPRCPR